MTAKNAYPKHLYDEKGNTIVVNSEDEEAALEGVHYESPADVPVNQDKAAAAEDAKPKEPIHPVEDDRTLMPQLKPGHEQRDRLVAEADRIGLKVDKRWSNERLQREIFEFASA